MSTAAVASHAESSSNDSRRAAKDAAYRVHSILREHPDDDVLPLIAEGDEDLTLPREALELLRRVLANIAAGQSVTIIPAHAELTTQQAADLLGVSRPYLIRLLDRPDNDISYRLVGTHRRVLAASLREYKSRMHTSQRAAADELTRLTHDLGLYE